jgi:hypothetical protein
MLAILEDHALLHGARSCDGVWLFCYGFTGLELLIISAKSEVRKRNHLDFIPTLISVQCTIWKELIDYYSALPKETGTCTTLSAFWAEFQLLHLFCDRDYISTELLYTQLTTCVTLLWRVQTPLSEARLVRSEIEEQLSG